jgi:transposase
LAIEQRQQQVITRLKNENARLRARVAAVEQENALLKTQISDVLMQLEELQRKVFGKKHHKPPQSNIPPNPPVSKRPHSSYRRPTPQPKDVTKTIEFSLQTCTDCSTILTNIKRIIRYQEDVLPLAEWKNALKTIEEHCVTTGYCPHCRKRISSIPIQKQVSTLGPNVVQLIPYLSIIQRMSFQQIRDFLKDIADLSVSDGEMSNILEKQSHVLAPCFENLKARIALQPGAHYDETAWKTQQEALGNYGWVKTGTESNDTVFLLGRSRGKGNAEELQTNNQDQIGITDDYGAYRTLFRKHQLCWAHPLRKLRELTQSEHLADAERAASTIAYESFCKLYQDLEDLLQEPHEVAPRTKAGKELQKRLNRIAISSSSDPPKLKRIKETLHKNQGSYFTCLSQSGIPPDNNKAERALRHLVLKRKVSFGSKTQKGADAMGILCSVLLSLWWSKPKNFFAEYAKLFVPSGG